MIKSISVIDTQGNIYEATYPKRAKGLVKKGRARFVDDTTICLARPPYHTEDEMEVNNTIPATPKGEAFHLDTAYVIAKIEQIMAESADFRKTLELLSEDLLSEDLLSEDHNNSTGSGALGISNMVVAREETNQAMISLLKLIVEKLCNTN